MLLIALHELRTLRRFRGGDDDGPRRTPAPGPKPSPGGTRALPPCLVPNANWRAPSLARVTEPA